MVVVAQARQNAERMQSPSDAQAAALEFIASVEEDVGTLYVRYELREPKVDYGMGKSYVQLLREQFDRENDTSWFEQIQSYNMPQRGNRLRGLRWETVDACIRRGWLVLRLPRYFASGPRIRIGLSVYLKDEYREEETLHELRVTEDGVIALGLWRERKLKVPPLPTPVLEGVDREVVALAATARRLGYRVLPRNDDERLRARRLTREGWITRGWGGGSTLSIEATASGVVEVDPDAADEPMFDERVYRP